METCSRSCTTLKGTVHITGHPKIKAIINVTLSHSLQWRLSTLLLYCSISVLLEAEGRSCPYTSLGEDLGFSKPLGKGTFLGMEVGRGELASATVPYACWAVQAQLSNVSLEVAEKILFLNGQGSPHSPLYQLLLV